MATMQAPRPAAEKQEQKLANTPAAQQENGAQQANGRGEGVGKSALVPADNPAKEKQMQEDSNGRSAPESPKTPGTQQSPKTKDGKPHNISPGERGSNLKAEAYADAHTKRVEAEAQAYIDSEARKAEAAAEKNKSVADKEKMKEEAKANENKKKEEQRAETVVHQAQSKAEKMIEEAKEKAVMIKANAKEVAEKHIAEANTVAEREKASIDEAKSKKFAEIKDQAETMIASGELAVTPTHKSVRQRLKKNLICSS